MEKHLEDIAYLPIIDDIMKDAGVDRETATRAFWALGEYMYENSDEDGYFYIPEEAFEEYIDEEDPGDGC